MAAANTEYCRCGLPSFLFRGRHGFNTHKGSCKKASAAGSLPTQPPAAPLLVAEAEASPEPAALESDFSDAAPMDLAADVHTEADSDNDTDHQAAGYVLRSATDIALAQMYQKYAGLSRSMLDEIVRLTHLGPATARSGAELLKAVDDLPGLLYCF